MEKRAPNSFLKGLNTDRHPLTSQNEELVDARNIDLLAIGEGYQLILQKREGNSKLLYEGYDAGLTAGFIPLTVQEFNNIAYIVSVNPNTGEGELGTFPSPDYDQFVYQDGGIPIGAPAVGTNVYDATATSPQYSYTVTLLSAHNGEVESIDGGIDANAVATYSSFVLKNTGLSSDVYTIDIVIDAHVFVYVDDTLYVDGVSLPGGMSAIITFKIDTPFLLVPETIHGSTASVTSIEVPTSVIQVDINYQTTKVFQVAVDGTWSTLFANGEYVNTLIHDWINSLGGDTGGADFTWRSNDVGLTFTSIVEVGGPFAWATTSYSTAPNKISIAVTPNSTGFNRGGEWLITTTKGGGGTITFTIILIQTPY